MIYRPIPEKDWIEYRNNAIKYLEKHTQYATINAVKIAINKQISMTPHLEADGYSDGELVYDTWICPNCETHYEVGCDEYRYCPNCGQKIDWSDKE